MNMFINGNIIHVNPGEGIFINSRRLHYNFSETKDDCCYFIVMIDFSMIQQQDSILSNYLQKKFSLNSTDYLTLHPNIQWEREIMENLLSLYRAMKEDEINPLRMIALGCDICASIGEHIPDSDDDDSVISHERMTFLKMTSYINDHFSERITLENIAASGNVCRSKCCQIFQQHVKQSPTSYLIQYRVAKSCELLRTSDMSIGEIAHQCGFRSSSYFTNVFQKYTGSAPREYRVSNIK